MNYKMRFMSGAEITISEELYKNISSMQEVRGIIKAKELGGMVNLSSVEYVLSEEAAKVANVNNPKSKSIVKCHDGSVAILKNGSWSDEYSGAKLDLSHYPELLKENNLLTLNQ